MNIIQDILREEKEILKELGLNLGDLLEMNVTDFSNRGGRRTPKIQRHEIIKVKNRLIVTKRCDIGVIECFSVHDMKTKVWSALPKQ